MNNPFDQFDVEEPVPQEGYKYGQLPDRVAQTPEEVVQTAQIEERDKQKNLSRLDAELARPGMGEKQRKALEMERLNLVSNVSDNKLNTEPTAAPANPFDQFDQAAALPAEPKGFLKTLRNPRELWTQESLPAHLISAYKKGVFDKPIGELVQDTKDLAAGFSMKQLFNAAIKDPGHFAGEVVNTVVADPYFLLPVFWEAAGGRVALALGGAGAKISSTAAKIGSVTGHALEAGVTGAGVSGAVSMGEQLDKAGFIDPNKLAQDLGVGAAMGAAMSGLLALGGSMVKAKPSQLAEAVKTNMREGDDLMSAMETAMQDSGMSWKKARSLVDEFEEAAKNNPDLEKDFAKMRKGIKPLVPEEAPAGMSPAQARQDLGRMAKELEVQRKSGELSEDEFARMTEDLKAQETARSAAESAPLDLPQQPRLDETTAEAVGAKSRILSGEAKGYGEEPSALAAREGFLAGKKVLTPSQAKELIDIQTYRDVLPELGVEPAAADVMTPSQAKAWVDSKAPDAPLPTAAKAVSPEMAEGTIPKFMTQRGVLDPEMAKWLALGVGGAALGGYLADDKGKGAVIGVALLLGGGVALKAGRHIISGGLEQFDKAAAKFKSLKRDPAIAKQTDDLLSAHQNMNAGMGLAADRLAYGIKELVPEKARREAITMAIDSGNFSGLSPKERTAARLFQEEDLAIGHEAQKRGVMSDLIENHIAHMWKDGGKARAAFSGMSGESRFAQARTIPSLAKGMELGLEPKTLDVAEIAQLYGRSVGQSMANKELIDALKTTKVAGLDARPVMPRADAPADYVPLPHPQLQGMLVNPEMAPSLSYLFHSNNIPAHLQAAMAVSAAAKQGLLNLSLFHAKSLLEVGLGIGLGFGTPKTLTKIPAMIEMLRKGKAGDFVDGMMRAGLKVDAHGFDMDTSAWAKLSNAVVSGLEKIPLVGKVAALPVKGVEKLSGALNNFLWEYLHPAIKLSTANVAYTRAFEGEAAKLIKDPSYVAKTPQAIMKEIAGATNDLFGGLDWRAVSGEIENKFLHSYMASRTNPEGLRGLRVALLAPDWLASTVRAGYKGIKATGKSAIPGTKLSVAEDMYRRYFLGGALMTAAVMEGMQQHFTGTHFWDNPDPTYVYLPDERKIQVAKHFTEIFHWLQDPAGTVVNKLGYLPKEAGAQLLDKEYLSAKGSPPMQEGRVAHALKGMLPIGVQEATEGRGVEAVTGTLGVPIHGRSQAEKVAAKRKLAIEISRRRQRQTKRTYR